MNSETATYLHLKTYLREMRKSLVDSSQTVVGRVLPTHGVNLLWLAQHQRTVPA